MSVISDMLYTFWNQLVYAVSNFRIFDLLDIIVIAFLLYKAIGFFRETRAGQLVKGIIVLIIVYAFANWFELAVLKWLLSSVVDSVIIAIAIIFQPELRRLLERVGQTKLGRGALIEKDIDQVSEAIDTVCKAARMMQDNKVGALIVFERSTQLGEIINTGTIVDAAASTSMINNIFFPKSPLHDGAMIIRDGRIYAAGCILPLTQNNNAFSSNLGTRHRAAIGMTENSDAIVLVVSEETGNISIVFDGQITRNYNSVTACAELRRQLLDDEVQKDNKIVTAIKHLNPFSGGRTNKEEVKDGNAKGNKKHKS